MSAPTARPPARAARRAPRREQASGTRCIITAICLGTVILAACLGRAYSARHLFDTRYRQAGSLSGDEVAYIVLGDRIWREGRYSTAGLESDLRLLPGSAPAYLNAPLFKHPPLFPALVGLSRALFPGAPWSAFLPGLVMGGLSLAGLFWLARETGHRLLVAFAAVVCLSLSPVHWICSSRIWLEVTLGTFVLLAVAAQIRAERRPRWFLVAGAFWACALLTKYTAFAAWLAVVATLVVSSPAVRRNRMFWYGHLLTVALCMPWAAARWAHEGLDVVAFWRSPVQDWRILAIVATRPDVALVALAAALAWAVWVKTKQQRPGIEASTLLVLATIAFLALAVLAPQKVDFGRLPWSGWHTNLLAGSGRDFYLARPLLFEPISWLGLAGVVLLGGRNGRVLVQAAWLGLALFLTAWGNFQTRYAMPLMPLAYLPAAAVVCSPFEAAGWRGSAALRLLALAWLAFSWGRSLQVMFGMGVENDFFYF